MRGCPPPTTAELRTMRRRLQRQRARIVADLDRRTYGRRIGDLAAWVAHQIAPFDRAIRATYTYRAWARWWTA